MDVTQTVSERLVRLPLWVGLAEKDVDAICDLVTEELSRID
jgi:dTDP-4-amino-4,6-dideoxygalactose transaminase